MRFFKRITRSLCFLLLLLLTIASPIVTEAACGVSHGARETKRIALSFDDGPHPRFTPIILDLLDRYGIKATFFMIGRNVESYPVVAKEVMARGHEIGNHTFSHPHMRAVSEKELLWEIEQTEKILADNGIPRPRLFRPPEGFRSEGQVKKLADAGYTTVIWSLDTNDWQGRASKEIVSVVLGGVRGGDILLFHDYTSRKNTITALEELIPRLIKDGYEFVTVSELLC